MGRELAVFDIDGTLYRSALLLDLIEGLRVERLLPAGSGEKARLLRDKWRDRQGSFNDYAGEVVRERDEGSFGSLTAADVKAVANRLASRLHHRVHVFTRELLGVLHQLGYECVAISGSPVEIVKPFAYGWDFHQVFATELELDPATGRYVNGIENAIFHVRRKGAVFRQAAKACGADLLDGSVAVGDTLSDLEMLALAKHPIAFNPDRELLGAARQHGIPVVLERKDTITLFRPTPTVPHSQGAGLEEAPLEAILPPDVAAVLRARLSCLGSHLD